MSANPVSTRPFDGVIFAAANLWAYLRHPNLALNTCVRLRRLVNFARPATHGEMMHWRKLFDHNPLFVTCCDKLAAKRHAQAICPDLPTAEVLWEGDDPALIPQALLTPGHVIKANNACGRNYLPSRGVWSRAEVLSTLKLWLTGRWKKRGEWAYGEVTPRIFVERELGGGPIIDLTFRSFGGRVAVAFVAEEWKTSRSRAAYFDAGGEPVRLPVNGAEALPPDFALPPAFHRAWRLAAQLGQGVDHLRVDFMLVGDDIYFNELTVYSASGYGDEDRVGLGPLLLAHWFASIEESDFLARRRTGFMGLYQGAFRRYAALSRARLSDLLRAPAPPAQAPSPARRPQPASSPSHALPALQK